MNCPACGHALSAHQVGEITVDVCRGGCGGVWFDAHELQRMDEPAEPVQDGLLDVDRDPSVVVDPEARRHCPRCPELVMMRHWFTVKREVVVDECPGCGGFFLDHGELAAIRGQFDSEDARRDAAREAFDRMFEEQLGTEAKASAEAVARSRRFAGMLKVLLPSWWIPGKQPWGAY